MKFFCSDTYAIYFGLLKVSFVFYLYFYIHLKSNFPSVNESNEGKYNHLQSSVTKSHPALTEASISTNFRLVVCLKLFYWCLIADLNLLLSTVATVQLIETDPCRFLTEHCQNHSPAKTLNICESAATTGAIYVPHNLIFSKSKLATHCYSFVSPTLKIIEYYLKHMKQEP